MACYVPGSVLVIRDTEGNKIQKYLPSWSVHSSYGDNKYYVASSDQCYGEKSSQVDVKNGGVATSDKVPREGPYEKVTLSKVLNAVGFVQEGVFQAEEQQVLRATDRNHHVTSEKQQGPGPYA